MVLDREWKKGIVANVLHAAGFYQVIVFPEEAANAEGEAEDTEPFVLNNVTIERIRKRYEKNDAVLIWRGRLIGWMYGIVLENLHLNVRITPISSPRWTPREKVSREVGGRVLVVIGMQRVERKTENGYRGKIFVLVVIFWPKASLIKQKLRSISYANTDPLLILRGEGSYLYDEAGNSYLDTRNNVCHVGHSHPRVARAVAQQVEQLNTNTRYLHPNLCLLAKRLTETFPTGSGLEVCFFVNSGMLLWGNVDLDAGERYAADVAAACKRAGSVAAFFVESGMSVGGVILPPPGYLQSAYQSVRHAGGVCVADEVQDYFWAFEQQGVTPDIVTMGKPFGNGMPLAAVVTTKEVSDAFHNGLEYFNTFGGNPVCCAAGLAPSPSEDIIREEKLQAHAAEVGGVLRRRLAELAQRHRWIGDVRGQGLFIGIEFVRKDSAEIPLETRLVMTDEGTAEEKAPISSFDRPEAEMTMVQVLVAGEVEPETLPSFRVHILPEHVGI
eukprot:g17752.t1